MLLARVCPWCRTTERRRQPCRCLPDGGAPMLVRQVAGIDVALALHPYEGVVSRFVLAAKNGGRKDLLDRFGAQLAESLGAGDPGLAPNWIDARPTVVWVPASGHKRRQRGYDQGRVLARSVGHRLGLAVMPLLKRDGGASQEGRDRNERLSGPSLRCRVARAPTQVLVVDDVITTGSSMAAAAATLRQAGSQRIIGVAVASSGSVPGGVFNPSQRLASGAVGGLW